MTIEVACPDCNGRLRVETPGTLVACPHCSAHLTAPSSADSVSDEPPSSSNPSGERDQPLEAAGVEEPAKSDEIPQAEEAAGTQESVGIEAEERAGTQEPVAPGESAPPSASQVPALTPAVTPPEFEAPSKDELSAESEFPDFSGFGESDDDRGGEPEFPSFDSPATPAVTSPADEAASDVAVAEPVESSPAPSTDKSEPSAVAAPAATVAPAANRPRANSVPRVWFILAISYASAMTIAFLFLLFSSGSADPHQLESLPDVPPKEDASGNAVFSLIPVDAPMPKGHTLKLGEGRRFGNVIVTPLRVTRAPLEFVHYSGDNDSKKSATSPVLKLWLRFENVSDDQTFAPLCKQLVFTRGFTQDDRLQERANNFVYASGSRQSNGDQVLVYDLPVAGDWDLKSQGLERELKPGEQFETYIPTTEEGLDQLQGPLVWRIHFRKGYNPDSLRGVTTLIEVEFHSDRIQQG